MPDSPAPAPAKRTRPAKPRPHGRSLADFPNLTPAEQELLRCARKGEPAVIADQRPEEKPENTVRAGLIRFLVLGGDDQAPVHEHGVALRGAWIEGAIDLDGALCVHPLGLVRCRLEQISAPFATLRAIRLSGCLVADGLLADHARIHGSLFLDKGFEARGPILLRGARIEGDVVCRDARIGTGEVALNCDEASIAGSLFLERGLHATGEVRLIGVTVSGEISCGGSRFENKEGDAITLDRAVIGGALFMHAGFHSEGAVRLPGASIGGVFVCIGGRFDNPDGIALGCDGASIAGNLFLTDGFHATGQVRLIGAKIGGDLICVRGGFENPGGTALLLDGIDVKGAFFFREVERLEGAVDLSSARVEHLVDDRRSWDGSRGHLILQDFTYARFGGPSPVDADSRIAWLSLQSPELLDERRFAPQPWEQLAAILKATGHPEEASRIAVAKHRRMRKAKRYVGGSWTWDLIYGGLVGYGYRPRRLLFAILGVWLVCTFVYLAAANPRWFGSDDYLLMPASPQPDAACLAARAAARSAAPCPPKSPRHEDLFLPAYSAEVLIPVVSLGTKAEWKPVVRTPEGEPLPWGRAVRAVYWFEIVFGWLASLLLVAAVGNLIKRD